MNGTSQITGNRATARNGGGIFSTSNVTFNGIKAFVKANKAHLPPSAGAWYQGYGVYASTMPFIADGFDPAKQVVGNTKA